MKKILLSFTVVITLSVLYFFVSGSVQAQESQKVMWINHLDFMAGDASVQTSFNAVSSGVGSGLSGFIIESTTVGDEAIGGGNKVIEKGLLVPLGYLVSGVRICYELTSSDSFISQIRLAQLQDPPSTVIVELDDATDHTDTGPICVDSDILSESPIDPQTGALRLSLRLNFGTGPNNEPIDKIVLRGVALLLVSGSEDSGGDVESLKDEFDNHTHGYRTGKGKGHNNTVAETSTPETDNNSDDEGNDDDDDGPGKGKPK